MGGFLRRSGHALVNKHVDADIVIINTCSFINPAKEEAIDEILTVAETKKNRPNLRIIVAGCLAQRYGNELLKHIPEADRIIGTGEVGNIVRHVAALNRDRNYRQAVITRPVYLMNCNHRRMLPASAFSTYLKISEGCSNHCSYCVIPSLRGAARSRPPDDILREAEQLAQRGIREIIITAQDTTRYGRNLKGRIRLSDLLDDLTQIKGIEWIRLLYAHPARITADLLNVIAENEKICSYIDLPIQHIDDTLLKAMNRRVTAAEIRQTIAQIRQCIPDVALRTSLIAGFPGETPARFNRMLDFVRQIRFDHLGVFTYSREEGTKAAGLRYHVPQREKERRREMIMHEQMEISASINTSLIGSVQEVLIEGESDRPDYPYIGRCRRQAPEIDGVTYLKGPSSLTGRIVKCKITSADEYDLFGKIIT